jgi:hypothetical protein
MKWLTALQLQQWAQGIPARTIFPQLIGDLIRATAQDVTAFRFPSGDKGQVRGFDGRLRTSAASTFVPEGDSIWEFGVTSAAASKADDDFNKRTGETLESERMRTTFVFATPQTWDNPKIKLDDWVQEKNNLKSWREVRYLDGSQLESWLDLAPAVAAFYARSIIKVVTSDGALSVQEYWKEYSTRFKPPLTEEVLLCDRAIQAEGLLRGLTGPPDRIVLAADSPEEVVAFAVAAIRKAPPETRAFIEARTLIVESEEAARCLAKRENLTFLPRGRASTLVGLLAQGGPTLVALGRENVGRRSDTLPRPTGQNLGRAIETMGFSPEAALMLARGCGRSVTIIARRIPSGRAQQPTWLQNPRTLLPALLAGAWDYNHPSDREAVAALSDGEGYEAIEDRLRLLTRDEDPFIDREGSVWKIRAPVDAFVQLGGYLVSKDFERLRTVARSVFSVLDSVDESSELEPGEHLRKPSQWLREGLATILLQIAVLYEEARLEVPGSSPQRYVNSIIEELPGLRSDARLLISIRDQLSMLAEAAPDPLLAALEQTLEGSAPTAKTFFAIKSDTMFGPTSPHVYVLWALEVLAWDPDLFTRTVLILAKLAELDPGVPSGNSPLESLRCIFLLWNPGTNASIELRLAVLDRLLEHHPTIGWALTVALLPKNHEHATPTARPRLREAAASERERITRRSLWEHQRKVVSRALDSAGERLERWVTLIKMMGNFLSAERDILFQRVEILLAQSNQDKRNELWRPLRDELNRHRSFSDAAWAIPEPELVRLAAIVEKYSPQDKIEKVRLLFDEWSPKLGRSLKETQEQQTAERKAALRSIYEDQGIDGLLKLASVVKLPHLIAENIPNLLTERDQYRDLLRRSISSSELSRFAASLSAVGLRLFGAEWRSEISKLATLDGWTSEMFAHAILIWPDDDSTWDFAQAAGKSVSNAYWSTKQAFHIDGSAETINRASSHYLEVGRSLAAIEALHDRINDLTSSSIFALLDAAVLELNAGHENLSNMLSYYLDAIFVVLQSRVDLDRMEIAKREYALLPLIEHEDRPLVLHKLMAQNADLYVQILSDVFRADDSPPSEVSSQSEIARARAAYSLLMQFKSVPGEDGGGIDQEIMRNWIDDVRRLATSAKRSEIADAYIGHILAHSAPESGIWPPVPVSVTLEKLKEPTIESGIMTERYNMRGVVTRSLFEGGEQERELARTYRKWLEERREYPRTAALLGRIANSWDREAELEDIRAQQDKLRS